MVQSPDLAQHVAVMHRHHYSRQGDVRRCAWWPGQWMRKSGVDTGHREGRQRGNTQQKGLFTTIVNGVSVHNSRQTTTRLQSSPTTLSTLINGATYRHVAAQTRRESSSSLKERHSALLWNSTTMTRVYWNLCARFCSPASGSSSLSSLRNLSAALSIPTPTSPR